ncbi:MAG: Piwi domain-containing protein [Candidatus Odinarchaeota archaeon]
MKEEDIANLGNQLKIIFNRLPQPSYWSKNGHSRIYFNVKGEDGSDLTFYIDFTNGNPVLGNYSESYWISKGLPSKKDLEQLVSSLVALPASKQALPDKKVHCFVEIFPIDSTGFPELHAYQIDAGGVNVTDIGGKLAFAFTKRLPGSWVWINPYLLTDTPPSEEDLGNVVENFRISEPETYKYLGSITPETGWNPSPYERAAFCVNGLFPKYDMKISNYLSREKKDLGNATVELVCHRHPLVVFEEPAVSVSISSRIICKQDLSAFSCTLAVPEDLIGIQVCDKGNISIKGEIIGVVGPLKDHRERLVSITKNLKTRRNLETSPDEELVVTVLVNRRSYDYAVSSLHIVVTPDDSDRFNIDGREALRAMRVDPAKRATLVKDITEPLIASHVLRPAYKSPESKHFISATDVSFTPELKFGDDTVKACKSGEAWRYMKECGLYEQLPRYQDGTPIKVGVLNALVESNHQLFWDELSRELEDIHASIELVHEERVVDFSRTGLRENYQKLEDRNLDIIVALFPNLYRDGMGAGSAYLAFKNMAIGRGIPNQVVHQRTLGNYSALGNIALGLVGKTGNVPFVLATPLPYADYVVGFDIVRERKNSRERRISNAAIARVYFGNGQFVRYVIDDTHLGEETIPESVLQNLFPAEDFQRKRVVIHRNGYFRRSEKEGLKRWAGKIRATFHFVEIIKTSNPRLYAMEENGKVKQPEKGTTFKINEREALLISTLPAVRDVTPLPLKIRTESPFTVEKAVHSVLSFTLLHYGSVYQPKLPVTVHYSDRIASMALRGIIPKALKGSVPFWL